MPYTNNAKFKVDMKKYKALVVDLFKSTKNARLKLLQGGKVIAVVECSNCKAGESVRVPLKDVDLYATDLTLVGEGEIDSFDITKLV